MEISSTFLMTSKEAGILIEGTESLIELNGFDKVLAFIKRVNDLAAIHGSTIILSVDKKRLSESQFKAISDEFDEIHDYE
jgi:archaellum biogenesis ATPase FlaH